VPGDPEQTMYVWIDALSSYLTASGWRPFTSGKWPADLHTIAKDIVKFHGIYWPAFLLAAGIPPYARLLVHGWWTIDRRKMGKSLGNARDPIEMRDAWGLEALKYFMLREATLTNDADLADDSIANRYNHELVATFACLVMRVMSESLVPELTIPPPGEMGEKEKAMIELAEALPGMVDHHVQFGRTRWALEHIWAVFKAQNRYICEEMPWRRAKDDKVRWGTIIYVVCESLRIAVLCLWPFMPRTAEAVLKALGAPAPLENDKDVMFRFGLLKPGTPITTAPREALFERKRASPHPCKQ
jgi:methionyl-tRNA synthetase